MARRKGQKRNSSQTARPVERPARRRPGGKAPARPPTAGGDSSSDDEAPVNDAPVHAPFKAPDPTRTVLFEDDDDDDDAAPPPPGSPRCVVCSTTHDVFIVERAKDLLRAEFYAWCCSSCARKYVKPRPDPKELCFATDDDEPLSPMKRTRLSF